MPFTLVTPGVIWHTQAMWEGLKTIGLVALLCASANAGPAEKTVDFAKHIQPILAKSCYRCHGEEKQEHELRLDRKADAMKGGISGKVIIPGDAKKSLLYKLITLPEESLDVMPTMGPLLNEKQKKLIKNWIDSGASWPEKKTVEKPKSETK